MILHDLIHFLCVYLVFLFGFSVGKIFLDSKCKEDNAELRLSPIQ